MMNDDCQFAPQMPEPSPAPHLKNHPELSGKPNSKFEEVANKLEEAIAALDKEVCELGDRLHLVMRLKQLGAPVQQSGPTPMPPPPAPIVEGTQKMSRQVNRIRDTIADILNRLEI